MIRHATVIDLCSQRTITSTSWMPIKASDLALESSGWLQRVMLWLCVKLRLTFLRPIEITRQERISIDSYSLLDLISQSQRDMDLVWNRTARYVIVGAETAENLWGEVAGQSFYSFDADFRVDRNHSFQYRGMKVVIVPWIRVGIFLLPDLEKQQ